MPQRARTGGEIINGRLYRGGQFIPDSALREAGRLPGGAGTSGGRFGGSGGSGGGGPLPPDTQTMRSGGSGRHLNSVTIDTSGINRILRNLDDNRDQAVRAIAFEVEARAKMLAPVDTGALRASIYTRTGQEVAPGAVPLPEPEPGVAHVGPSVHYAIYQELGTSEMAAQPFLGPAVASVLADLERFRGDFRRLAEGR